MSSRRPPPVRVPGRTSGATTAAVTAIGTLTRKTQRHPAHSVSTPPSNRPLAPPAEATAPNTPRARLRPSPSRKVVVNSARAAGETTAPASPWPARATTSMTSLTASPASSDVTPKSRIHLLLDTDDWFAQLGGRAPLHFATGPVAGFAVRDLPRRRGGVTGGRRGTARRTRADLAALPRPGRQRLRTRRGRLPVRGRARSSVPDRVGMPGDGHRRGHRIRIGTLTAATDKGRP